MTKNQKFTVAVSIFIGFFLLALFTSPPKLPTGEGLEILKTSARIFNDGDFKADSLESGREFSRHGVGEPLLLIPFVPAYLKTKEVKGNYKFIIANLVLYSFPALVFALTAMILFLTSLQFGNSTITSLLLAFIASLATMLWQESQTFFTDSLLGLLLLTTLYSLFRHKKTGGVAYLLLGGFTLGYGVLTNIATIAIVPFFTIYLLYTMLVKSNYFSTKPEKKKPFPVIIFIYFLFVLSTPIAVALWYNNIRYGYPLAGNIGQFGGLSFFSSLYLLFFSSGKGLFFYNPILLLAVFGLRSFGKKHLDESLLIFAIFILWFVIYAKGWGAMESHAWSSRFFITLIPLMVLLTGNLVEELLSSWELGSFFEWAKRGGAILLLSLSLLIQIPSILINPNDYINLYSDNSPNRENSLYLKFVPQFSPLAGHIWMAKSIYYKGSEKYKGISTTPPWKGFDKKFIKKINPATFEYNIWWLYAKKIQLLAFIILLLSAISFFTPIYLYKSKEVRAFFRLFKVLFVMLFPRQNVIQLKKNQNKETLA